MAGTRTGGVDDTQHQIGALSQRLNAMRSEQRSHSRRLQQADSLNRVLRDELDGITQRAALLEDSVSKLADPDRHGAQALRLDEAEMLLCTGENACRSPAISTARAAPTRWPRGVLDGIDDPAYLSLRQTLLQERAALDALGADPRVKAIANSRRTRKPSPRLPGATRSRATPREPWWRARLRHPAAGAADRSRRCRALRRSRRRAGGIAAGNFVGARRGRTPRRSGYREALRRADAWLQRLAPDPAALAQQRAKLRALAAMPLSLSVPTLGSTLQQLRQLRAR